MENLKNKVIAVAGGSGLIGREILKKIKASGAIAINADINVDNNLDESNIKLDITDDQSIIDAINQIVSKFGKIDGWVNSAYPRTKDWGNKLESIDFESWRENIDWHLNGYFISSKLVTDQMVKQRHGSLVNLSSIYGMVGPDFTVYENSPMTMPVAYSAIKAGIINLGRYLASYYGKSGVRVNTVSPGGIFDYQPEEFLNRYNKKVPLGRMGEANEIAGPVVFLLSDSASYITGHNLIVDGGWTAI
jgi:NAD(P)-dependent dehydrogenase (short-subunit alcohol dehydrogenase family)